ncbi:ankyrin repeat domain-containing protein [Enterococcus sp. LJL98]
MKYFFVIGLIAFLLGGCTHDKPAFEDAAFEQVTSQSSQVKISETTETTKERVSVTYSVEDLIKAVEENQIEEVKEILKQKHELVNEQNAQGETALLFATQQNQVAIAKQLIDAGADINLQDTIQDSPYLYAGAQGRTEILAYMLEKATPDQQIVNRYGGNALIPAAEKGHVANVKLLLADGRVAIDHQNNFGYTALIEAVALRDGSPIYLEIVQELLKYKADASLRDNSGRTAEDYAKELGYMDILKELQR